MITVMHDARSTGSASVLIPVPGMVHGTYCIIYVYCIYCVQYPAPAPGYLYITFMIFYTLINWPVDETRDRGSIPPQ